MNDVVGANLRLHLLPLESRFWADGFSYGRAMVASHSHKTHAKSELRKKSIAGRFLQQVCTTVIVLEWHV